MIPCYRYPLRSRETAEVHPAGCSMTTGESCMGRLSVYRPLDPQALPLTKNRGSSEGVRHCRLKYDSRNNSQEGITPHLELQSTRLIRRNYKRNYRCRQNYFNISSGRSMSPKKVACTANPHVLCKPSSYSGLCWGCADGAAGRGHVI